MAAYTYDDFVNKATGAGLLGNFSSYDLDLAKKYPEFGLSILSLKQDYNRASTDEARALANQAANQLRSSYGSYTGGRDGSLYIADGLSPGSYQSEYKNKINEVLGQMGAFGDFSYNTPAPAYTNQYKSTIDSLLDQIVNREDFSYNKDEDPNWSAYKKQYRREGDRATASALAQASAASGGLPSSYAVNAATQAGDYYAAQLSDMLPTLYQQAYDRYLNEYQMKQSDLAAVNSQEQNDYQKYLTDLSQWNTDRNFAYTDYINRFNRLQSQLGAYQTQDDTEYGRLLDQVNYNTQKSQAQASALQQQVENALNLWSTYGYATEDVANTLGVPVGTPTSDQAYIDWNKTAKGSAGSVRTGSSGKPSLTWAQTLAQIEAGNLTPNVLGAYEYYMGEAYQARQSESGAGTGSVHGSSGNLVSVPGYGEVSYDDAEALEAQGLIRMTGMDSDGKPVYQLIKRNSGNIVLSR